jgi:hypothetical protein
MQLYITRRIQSIIEHTVPVQGTCLCGDQFPGLSSDSMEATVEYRECKGEK